jgi:hypothetical protein
MFEAALYWDKLTSLVPEVDHSGGYTLREDLRRMQDADLYSGTSLDELVVETSAIVETVERVIQLAKPGDLDIPDELNSYTSLLSGKLPHELEWALTSRDLLVRDSRDESAWRGNPRILLAVLACAADLASMRLEDRSGHRYVPTTSSRFAHQCATLPLTTGTARLSWMIDVGGALPVPDSDTPIDKVLAFRSKYEDERQRCIAAVRQLQARLRAEIANPAEVLREQNRELADAVADLRNAGRGRFKWGLKRVVWTLVATAAGTVAGTPVASITPVIPAAVAAATGITVNLATAQSRTRDDRYTYLHQLETEFPFANIVM